MVMIGALQFWFGLLGWLVLSLSLISNVGSVASLIADDTSERRDERRSGERRHMRTRTNGPTDPDFYRPTRLWRERIRLVNWPTPLGILRWVGGTMPKLAWGLLLIAVGFAANDLWRFHHTYVLNDMTVIGSPGEVITEDGHERPLAPHEYFLQRNEEPRGQAFSFLFCANYDPTMRDGNHIRVMVYEVKFTTSPPCRDVGGGKLGILFH